MQGETLRPEVLDARLSYRAFRFDTNSSSERVRGAASGTATTGAGRGEGLDQTTLRAGRATATIGGTTLFKKERRRRRIVTAKCEVVATNDAT